MPFTASAILMVTVCPAYLPCKNFELARFGMEQTGVNVCEATAQRMNRTAIEGKTGSVYFCLPADASNVERAGLRP